MTISFPRAGTKMAGGKKPRWSKLSSRWSGCGLGNVAISTLGRFFLSVAPEAGKREVTPAEFLVSFLRKIDYHRKGTAPVEPENLATRKELSSLLLKDIPRTKAIVDEAYHFTGETGEKCTDRAGTAEKHESEAQWNLSAICGHSIVTSICWVSTFPGVVGRWLYYSILGGWFACRCWG